MISVASHLVGPQIRQMIELIETGDVPAARKIHESLSPLFNALFITSNPIPVKAALQMVGRPCGEPRLPLVPATAEERDRIRKALEDAGLLCLHPVCRLVFLGGVGEVGRNMACLELDGRLLILDVGLSFPSADMPGIDLVLPDIEYVRERADDVEAVVLTHGHEDHVGALPYLLRDLGRRVPVYGTPFTLELLARQARGARGRATWRDCDGGARRGRPASARSRCASTASRTRSPTGWRWRSTRRTGPCCTPATSSWIQTPIDGRPTDLHGLAEEASGCGVHVLLSDSTNAEEAGLHRQRAQRRPGAAATSSRARPRSWWWRASPATSTGSSRSWTRRSADERVVCVPRPVDAQRASRRRAGSGSSMSTTATSIEHRGGRRDSTRAAS